MALTTRRLFVAASLAVLPACGGGGSDTPTTPTGPVAGCATESVANEGWAHVAEGSATSYRHDPPASGNHYPVWARYEEHTVPVARGYWVHNLEHGGIVFLYKPGTAAATVDALRAAYRALPNDPACGHKRALFAADPALSGETAVVAADFVLQSGCTDSGAIRAFVNAHIARGPEQVCENGTRP